MSAVVCPFCGYDRNLILRKFLVADLAELWLRHFGFDPFADHPAVELLYQFSCMRCYLIFHSPQIYGDDQFYSRLSEHDWYYESEKWEFDVALDLISKFKPASLLEVGCGSGEFLYKVSSGVDRAVGVDINSAALTRARSRGLEVINQPISMLQDRFDMIVLFQVLEHLESPGDTLAALLNRLNPGGILVIAVPNPAGYLKEQGVVLLDLPPHHNTKWSRETFSYICQHYGLQEVIYVTEPIRYIHYQAYMAAIIASGTKRRIVRHIQHLAFKVVGPLLFDIARERILGQTHLVALRKLE